METGHQGLVSLLDDGLETFLRGMETSRTQRQPDSLDRLETFLRGMETAST